MKALVYEGFQHFIPTGRGWVKGLTELGWEVYELPATQYRIAEVDETLDLMIVHDMDQQRADDMLSYKASHPDTKMVVLCSTFEPFFDSLKDCVNLWMNLSIKNTYLENHFKSRGMKFANVQLAAHPQYSFPIDGEKTVDVSFVGQIGNQGHGYRDEDKYLFPVIDKGYRSIFGAFSYKGIQYAHKHYSELNGIYNRTKINLNFHYSNQKIERADDPLSRIELNGRVFEIALSGNFQMCDHPIVEKYFDWTIPYVTPDKWLERIDYYLAHEDEAKRLGLASRTIAQTKHTYGHRAQQILKELEL